jgi:ADP-ribose pyrophosphatase YjhB (NUDIX family)
MPRTPRFCPYCATPLTKRPQGIGQEVRSACPACSFVHFDNPAPAAGVLVVDTAGRVLLGRRGHAPFKGWWGIVGGFVEGAEHPQDTAVREVFEEIGLHVRVDRLLGLWMDRYGRHGDHTVNLVFVGSAVAGTPQTSKEVTELGWFEPHALPKRIAFRAGRAALQAWADEALLLRA